LLILKLMLLVLMKIELNNLIQEYNLAKARIKRDRERLRDLDGERRIRQWRRIDDNRDLIKSYEKELRIINDFKNRNLKEIQFGKELKYYPFDEISSNAREIQSQMFRRDRDRNYNRMQRALGRHRNEEMIKEKYPNIPQKVASEFARKLTRGESVSIPLKYSDQATIRKVVEDDLKINNPRISMFRWTLPKKYEELINKRVRDIRLS